jgi:hypothetical protein
MASQGALTGNPLGPATSYSPEQHIFCSGLSKLLEASKRNDDLEYHKILLNIELLTFALCWFGMASIV